MVLSCLSFFKKLFIVTGRNLLSLFSSTGFFINGILFFISVLIGLGLSEFCLRVIDPNGASHKILSSYFHSLLYQADDYQHHVFIPETDVVYKSKEFNVFVTTNSIGLRDYPLNKLKDMNKRTVLFLGDSFIAGLHVSLEKTIAKQLEHLLNSKESPEFTVINAGASSYSPAIEYLYLKTLGPLFRPEFVILGLFINDFGGDFEILNSPDATFDDKGILRTVKGHEGSSPGFFYRHFYLYHFINDLPRRTKIVLAKLISRMGFKVFFRPHYNVDLWDNKYGEDYLQRSVRNAQYLDATFSYLRHIRTHCEKNDISFIVVILPQPNQVGSTQVKAGWQSIWYSPIDYIESTYYQDVVLDFCSKEDILCLDLLPALREADRSGIQLYLKHNGHWNEKGHHFAAKQIFNFLYHQGGLE